MSPVFSFQAPRGFLFQPGELPSFLLVFQVESVHFYIIPSHWVPKLAIALGLETESAREPWSRRSASQTSVPIINEVSSIAAT